jgi:hypothetical protein
MPVVMFRLERQLLGVGLFYICFFIFCGLELLRKVMLR